MIYYAYYKTTKFYAGSGTPFIDTEECSCTTVECPSYDEETSIPVWNEDSWVIQSIEEIIEDV